MKQITFIDNTSDLISGAQFSETMDKLFNQCDNYSPMVFAISFLGLWFSVTIVNKKERTVEETKPLLDDILRHTIMVHRKHNLRSYEPVIYKSNKSAYWGITCIHPSLDDAKQVGEAFMKDFENQE